MSNHKRKEESKIQQQQQEHKNQLIQKKQTVSQLEHKTAYNDAKSEQGVPPRTHQLPVTDSMTALAPWDKDYLSQSVRRCPFGTVGCHYVIIVDQYMTFPIHPHKTAVLLRPFKPLWSWTLTGVDSSRVSLPGTSWSRLCFGLRATSTFNWNIFWIHLGVHVYCKVLRSAVLKLSYPNLSYRHAYERG